MPKKATEENLPQGKDKRKYVNQSDVPIYSLEEALKIPQVIVDEFGGKPTAPFQVALAIGTTQASRIWRSLSGSAVAYGLTDGGYNSTKIGLTDLAKRIIMPTSEGAERPALLEAAMKPSVTKRFYEKYNNAKFPKENIGENVLTVEYGIPKDDAKRVLELIKGNAQFVGIIHDTKTGPFVFIDNNEHSSDLYEEDEPKEKEELKNDSKIQNEQNQQDLPEELLRKLDIKNPATLTSSTRSENSKKKVFISHGKNKKVLEQLKEILTFGQFEVIISIEKETTAISVPDKVFSDMRNCDAAVIHVEGEKKLLDEEGNVHSIINENVLIEIGAAIALYGRKFVLLCESSLNLPSNLQGLYRCNYEGKELSYDATMKLLKAFNEFRNS